MDFIKRFRKKDASDKPAPQDSLSDPPAVWRVGDVIIDLYEVTSILGEGGMGTVYKVHHKGWNVDLAVKSPRPEIFSRAGGQENFIREAETWVNLGLHPHTVSCYYVRTLGGTPRIFVEYVEGGSLKDWINSRRLYEGGKDKALERILNIAIQFAWGLEYAHEQGLVHQDVKPANVMMTPDGIAKVTDFGLAKARSMAGEVSLPGGMQSILVSSGGMTPAYSSPEQAAGKPLSPKTDIWSWGVSMLEMFFGETPCPYGGQTAAEVLEGYLEYELEDPSIPAMPVELVKLMRSCFQKQAQQRPIDMLEVAGQLQVIYLQMTRKVYPRQMPKAVELRADSLNNRALSLLDLGKPEQAGAIWEKALKIDPLHPEAMYNRGLVLWRSAQMTDDILLERLRGVSASHLGEWLPSYLTGLVHLEGGDYVAAIEALKGIKELDADREEVVTALALATSGWFRSRQLLRTFESPSTGSSGVQSVCLSADGRYALSGGWGHPPTLWEVASGRCLRNFEVGLGRAGSVCLSADGRYALSSSSDLTLKLWKVGSWRCLDILEALLPISLWSMLAPVVSGRCLRTFKGHTDDVNSVCLSVDGRYALSSSADHTLKLWEVESGRCLRTFEGHTYAVSSVCLSADGRYALSGSWDNTLKLWEVESGRCLRTFKGHTYAVSSVCLSADGRYALSGSWDNTLKLWEVESGRCLRTFKGHTDDVNSVCLSVDGRYALSSSADHTLKLWDTASERCLHTFQGHTDKVNSMCLSANGRYALSGSADHTLKLWEVQLGVNTPTAPFILSRIQDLEEILSNKAIYDQSLLQARQELDRGQLVEAARHIRRARVLPGYQHAAEALEVWHQLYRCLPLKSINGGWQAAIFVGHTNSVTTVCLSMDGRYALSGSKDKALKQWEVESGRCLRTFVGHEGDVTSVCLSKDGRYAMSGSRHREPLTSFMDNGMIKLWDAASGSCLRTFAGHRYSTNSVCLSIDERYALSSGDSDGDSEDGLKLWDAASGRCLRTFMGHTYGVNSVCLSADGRYALVGCTDWSLKLLDVASGRCLRTFKGHTYGVNSVCLSADGRYALSGSWDNTLKLWEVASECCLRTFVGHEGDVTSVCLSKDGRYAMSGSSDKTLKMWEVASGRCLLTFEGHTDTVSSVCLSADGRYALSGSWDKTLRLWVLDWDLEDREPADWEESARPYLQNFLTQHTPYTVELSTERQPSEKEITLALTKHGKPSWSEGDFQQLMLNTLGFAGYGWLRPEGVRRELERMARDWQGPPDLFT